jgi:hypothetical protein
VLFVKGKGIEETRIVAEHKDEKGTKTGLAVSVVKGRRRDGESEFRGKKYFTPGVTGL